MNLVTSVVSSLSEALISISSVSVSSVYIERNGFLLDHVEAFLSCYYYYKFVGSCLCNGTPLPSQADSYHLSSLSFIISFSSSWVSYIFWLFMQHPCLCGLLYLMFSNFSFHIFFTSSLDSIHIAVLHSLFPFFISPISSIFILIIKPMCISYFLFFFITLSFPSSLSSPSTSFCPPFTPNHFSLPLLLCSIFRFHLVPSFFLSFLLLLSNFFYFIPFSFRFIFLSSFSSFLRFFSLSTLLRSLDENTPAYCSENRKLFAW